MRTGTPSAWRPGLQARAEVADSRHNQAMHRPQASTSKTSTASRSRTTSAGRADARASGDGDGVESFIEHLDMTGIMTGATADAAPQPGRSRLAGPADPGSGAGDPAARPRPDRASSSACAGVTRRSWPCCPRARPRPRACHDLRNAARAGKPAGAALRILRQLVMERLVVLDCATRKPAGGRHPRHDRAGRIRAGRRLQRGVRGAGRPPRRADGRRTASAPSCGWSAWASSARASSMSPATST